jgi:peptide/nickel transport system substrate-binding protein
VFGGSTRQTFISMDAAGRSGDTPLKNAEVRRAIAMAINRNAIAEQLIGNGARVLNAQCNLNQTFCLGETLSAPVYDARKAKEMLAAAGYPNGFRIAFESSEDLRQIGEAIQGSLAQIGVRADYSTATLPAWRSRYLQGASTMSVLGWGGAGGLDVDYALATFYNGSETDYARDPEITGLIAEGRKTADSEARKAIYRKALTLINERAYSVPLFGNVAAYVMAKELDFQPPKVDSPDLTWAKWVK